MKGKQATPIPLTRDEIDAIIAQELRAAEAFARSAAKGRMQNKAHHRHGPAPTIWRKRKTPGE